MYSIFSPHLSIYGYIHRYELYIIWVSQQTFQKGIIIPWHRLCEVTMLIFEIMSLLSWSLSVFCLFNLFVSLCMHVPVGVCMCVHACLHMCVCVHACVNACTCVCVCLPVCLHIDSEDDAELRFLNCFPPYFLRHDLLPVI